MVSLIIEGKEVEAKDGVTILNAAQGVGIDIPTFCFHKDMEPYGGCRLCMVEVTENDVTRLLPSCVFPAKNNTIVKTNTERVVKGRKIIAELLLARCPNSKAVRNLAESLGVTNTDFSKDDENCVLCGQCVRVCRNVAKAGAIDFVNRGRERFVGTPFDLPSDDCIGCGSCAYVCPTGAMNMEYENTLRWRNLPGAFRNCRYMRMGFLSHKVCPNNYECWNCEVDQRMEDLGSTHPVFMLKEVREKEHEIVDQFEILPDRLYYTGHIWVKRINGSVRLGIDDFSRQLLGNIDDIKLPAIDTEVASGDPIFSLSASGKNIKMNAPLEGKIIDINPGIFDNPSLISMAPYDRGWILSLQPKDILQASRELLSGRSAKEWLRHESLSIKELIRKKAPQALDSDGRIPVGISKTFEKQLWNQIQKIFFDAKKKKRVTLKGIDRIHSAPVENPEQRS